MSNESTRPRGATFGKPDKTGRSSGKLSPAERKLLGPRGKPFAWQPTELLASDAWRGMSLYCHRFVDFLQIEHGNHAGRENGNLAATYDQLKRFGISRPRIKPAIAEAVARGLVEVTVAGGMHGSDARRTASRYRLTWTGCLNPAKEPTNEWRTFVEKTFSRCTPYCTRKSNSGAPRTAPDKNRAQGKPRVADKPLGCTPYCTASRYLEGAASDPDPLGQGVLLAEGAPPKGR